jgi:competence protein ComEA
MFSVRTFLALIVTTIVTVSYLAANTAYAGEKAPVVASSQQVNINTADAQTLSANLKGIGLKKAEAIVKYRETYGAFHDAEELTEVKGIGPSILKKNEGLVVVK